MSAADRSPNEVHANRVFLGWDRPLLHAAADWLPDTLGDALPEHLVVVPGRRAERRLLERLVDRLPGGRPPRLVTAGALVDALVGERGRVASRLARTLAWAGALSDLPAEQLAALVPHPPARDDLPGWRELGALVRGLHGALAAADHDLTDVVELAAQLGGPGEGRRWRALARAQTLYLQRLSTAGWQDPHASRRRAVEQGALDIDARVVLVGVVEAAGLQRAALSRLRSAPTALVFAPEHDAPRFDALGCVLPLEPGAVAPPVPVDRNHWWVEDRPADQAERVLRLLADPSRARPADEITIGLLDPSVGPPLARRLGEQGVTVRDVAGTPIAHTAPLRLLQAAAAWLDDRDIDAFAALVRHPDLPLDAAAVDRCLASDLDAYRAAHLPRLGRAPWLASDAGADDPQASRRARREAYDERDRRRALTAVTRALETQLGELADGAARAPSAWAEPVRAWLSAVYGARELRAEASERDRVLSVALETLGRALDELAAAVGWSAPVSAAVALGELSAALSGAVVPPPQRADAIELLGWLELPFDDAPLLLLTGVNDGRLPESVGDDPFLTEALAVALGLPDDRARLARDAYLLTAVLHSRAEVQLVTGRRSQDNEPLRPSRLLFACDDDELLARVERLVSAGRRRPPPATGPAPAASPRPLPMAPARERTAQPDDAAAGIARDDAHDAAHGVARDVARDSAHGAAHAKRTGVAGGPAGDAGDPRVDPATAHAADAAPTIERYSPSAFRAYLASPYRYYLERVLFLRGVDDRAEELDPLVFGTLAHAVLEGLAHHAAGASTDARAVAAFLLARLDALAAERFGRASLPAVALQLQQLRARLAAFARWQAGWIAEGWRIRHAEWRPSEPVLLDAAGGPFAVVGVIDRIDQHEATGRWAVLDYKSSETAQRPDAAHRRGDRWVDLQLPLYRLLVGELGLPWPTGDATDPVQLGYVNLPADPDEVGAVFVSTEATGRREAWDAALLDSALDLAREVVAAVRAERFAELGDVVHPMADEPIVRALAGLDLLDAAAAPPLGDDDDADGGGDVDGDTGSAP